MKNMFLKWVIFSLWFCLTIWIFIFSYAAWINISNVSSSDTLTATWWNNMISNINDLDNRTNTLTTNLSSLTTTVNNLWTAPSWAIMAFYLTTCPTWWKPADGTNSTPDLRWAFLRWLNWNVNWRDDVRALWHYQTDLIKSTAFNGNTTITKVAWWECIDAWFSYGNGNSNTCNIWNHTITISWNIGSWNDTRPKNVAVLFCVKN